MSKILSEASKPQEDNNKYKENINYVAKVGCSYKNLKKVRAGEMVPASWPKEAIEHLLKRDAIAEVTNDATISR